MDIAELGLSVRSDGVVVASDRLKRFKGEATEADRAAHGLSGTMRILGAAMAAIGIAGTVRGLITYADTWTDLRSRVDLATGSQEAGAVVMERLSDMARRTYSSLEQTAESWLSNATALRELGMSTRESLAFTEALNNAMVVSGAKAERAASVQNALSKAMAIGKLSGENLNTVIQTGGRLAELLAEEMGTTVSGLRTLGQEGTITGEVIQRALLGNLEKLREEADSMPATIGDAMQLTANAALALVGTWDHLLGSSSAVAGAIIGLADNLDRVAAYAITFVGIIGVRYVAAMAMAHLSTLTLAGALTFLRAALIRIGFGLLIVAAGELVYWFGRLVTGAGSFGGALSLLKDVASEVFDGIGQLGAALGHGLNAVWAGIQYEFLAMIKGMRDAWADFVGWMADQIEQMASVPALTWGDKVLLDFNPFGGAADAMRASADQAKKAATDLTGTMEGLNDTIGWEWEQSQNALEKGTASIGSALSRLRDAVTKTEDDLGGGAEAAERLSGALEKVGGSGGSAGRAADAIKELPAALDEVNQGAQTVSRGLADAFTDAITGAKSLRSAVSDLLAELGRLAINNAFMGLFGGLGRGGIGAALGSIFSTPSFAGGGYTGDGPRSGGLDGKGGFAAVVHPRETIVDHTKPGVAAQGGKSVVEVHLSPELIGQVVAQADSNAVRIVQAGAREAERALPGRIADYGRDRRKRF